MMGPKSRSAKWCSNGFTIVGKRPAAGEGEIMEYFVFIFLTGVETVCKRRRCGDVNTLFGVVHESVSINATIGLFSYKFGY